MPGTLNTSPKPAREVDASRFSDLVFSNLSLYCASYIPTSSHTHVRAMSLVTSSFLGPLTTVWTPPTACLETITYSPSAVLSADSTVVTQEAALYFGATGNAVDLVCYPPRFKTDNAYSPGVCPNGDASESNVEKYFQSH